VSFPGTEITGFRIPASHLFGLPLHDLARYPSCHLPG
jgi:hypothetical protein